MKLCCILCAFPVYLGIIFNKPLLFIQKIKTIHLIIDLKKIIIFTYLYMGRNLLKIDFSEVAFRQAPLLLISRLAENKRISRFKIVPSKHDFKSAIDS